MTQQVYIVVARDLIDEPALLDRQPVAAGTLVLEASFLESPK